jgi:hypothetical protein
MPKVQLISKDESFIIGDAEHWYRIRRPPQEIVREIRRRHTVRIEPEMPGMPFREETDEGEVDRDLLDYLVIEWGGIELTDGSPAPCTREHKAALPATEKNQIFGASGVINLSGESGGSLKNLSGPSVAQGPGDLSAQA